MSEHDERLEAAWEDVRWAVGGCDPDGLHPEGCGCPSEAVARVRYTAAARAPVEAERDEAIRQRQQYEAERDRLRAEVERLRGLLLRAPCPNCEGKGRTHRVYSDRIRRAGTGDGRDSREDKCRVCGGSGRWSEAAALAPDPQPSEDGEQA